MTIIVYGYLTNCLFVSLAFIYAFIDGLENWNINFNKIKLRILIPFGAIIFPSLNFLGEFLKHNSHYIVRLGSFLSRL